MNRTARTDDSLVHQKPGKKSLISLILLGISLICVSCQTPPKPSTTSASSPSPSPYDQSPSLPRFDGVTLKVLTRDPPQIAEPLKRYAPIFEKLTGAKVEVSTVPFGELYHEIQNNLSPGTKQYDVIVFAPQWLVDYASKGYLENLTERIATDSAIQWKDIAPFFSNFSSTYKGNIYSIPLDGDFQMVYYRTDLLQKSGLNPPQTWEDYLAIAKQFHGQDLNGDGTPDYGSCIAKKPNNQAYWMFWSFVSPYLQTQGTQQSTFFDPDTFKPLINNEGFATALNLYKETTKYAPPNEIELDLFQTRDLFTSGRCAVTLDWGDIGTLAIAPESKVVDKVGSVILPGTRKVVDRSSGKLVECDKLTCPYALNGVNHAPYAAFGGWSGAINKTISAKNKDAAYAFLSYISQPAHSNRDVTIGVTGFNPYRISQFTNREEWLKAGMSFEAASKYLGAINVSLSSPNMVLDLRIPDNNRYMGEVLDQVLADFLRDKITQEEAIQQIDQGWEKITNEIGREQQRKAYRASLGLSD